MGKFITFAYPPRISKETCLKFRLKLASKPLFLARLKKCQQILQVVVNGQMMIINN